MKSIFVAAMAGGAQALFNQPQEAVCEGAFQYYEGMPVQGKSHICAKAKKIAKYLKTWAQIDHLLKK